MRTLTAISFGLALAASCLLLVLPVCSGFSGGAARRATLIDVNGRWVLIHLAVPVLITLIPLAVPKRPARIGACVTLTALAVIAGFSIGLFYWPSAFVLLLAGFAAPPALNR